MVPARALELLGAIPIAALALALSELTRLPARVVTTERLLAALAQLMRSALTTFALPALALVTLVMVLAMRPGRARALALFALGPIEAALVHLVMSEHASLAWHPIVIAASAALGLALGLAHLGLASPRLDRHRTLALVVGVATALGALALARAHYAVLVGHYPGVHAAAMQVAFFGLALGVAAILAALDRPSLTRRVALALATALVLGAILEPPASAAARPYVIAYTELGRGAGVAAALYRDRAHLFPTELPPSRPTTGLLRADPHARSRFAAHAHLPALSRDFDLAAHDVVLILMDAARHDRAMASMPHLRRLAASAQRFDRAYSPSNGTFPSVASMLAMTPVSFAELDVRPSFWRGRLREERTTAAEAMRAAGRATFWVGHDHRGCFRDHIHGLDQGFDAVTRIHQERGDPADADVDARIADAAIDAIGRHRASSTRFFGLVFFVSPHDDYQAHGPGAPDDPRARYDGELAYGDAQLARVLATLDDDTVVIFAGDHGEAFGEHGHRHHLTSLHDEQIHVPLVVRVPGLAPAVHEAPTSTAYVLPWLLLRGAPAERAAAERVLREDVGPMMRALDGAVLSEMIGPRAQHAALMWDEQTIVYDVFADLARIYDARRDPAQLDDLREARPALFARFAPFVRRYRSLRYAGRRFRFTETEGATP